MINGKPVICVTSDDNFLSKPEGPRQLCSPYAYSAAIAAAGGFPVIAPEQCVEEFVMLCDGLLLTGGDDVDPYLYNEELFNDTVKPDPQRTEYELPLAKAFLAAGKPILTICRGFQLINCILGGSLYQDLLEQKGWIHMEGKIRHMIYTEKGSILNNLFGDEFKSNSTHHQAIKVLAKGLKCTGRSVEGIVEAYEHETLPIFGTQFHPERLTGCQWDDRTPNFAPYFKHFIEMVRNHK